MSPPRPWRRSRPPARPGVGVGPQTSCGACPSPCRSGRPAVGLGVGPVTDVTDGVVPPPPAAASCPTRRRCHRRAVVRSRTPAAAPYQDHDPAHPVTRRAAVPGHGGHGARFSAWRRITLPHRAGLRAMSEAPRPGPGVVRRARPRPALAAADATAWSVMVSGVHAPSRRPSAGAPGPRAVARAVADLGRARRRAERRGGPRLGRLGYLTPGAAPASPPPPRSSSATTVRVPSSYDELPSLPGIGDYTAAAIASRLRPAARRPDTNVRRVPARAVQGVELPGTR